MYSVGNGEGTCFSSIWIFFELALMIVLEHFYSYPVAKISSFKNNIREKKALIICSILTPLIKFYSRARAHISLFFNASFLFLNV